MAYTFDEPFEVDLNKVKVYGFESHLYVEVLESLERGMLAGDELPPVLVHRVSDTEYHLVLQEDPRDTSNFGGKHRLALAYVLGRPLKVQTYSGSWPLLGPGKVSVEGMTIESDPEKLQERIEYDEHFCSHKRYR